jgi:hypothetical protein
MTCEVPPKGWYCTRTAGHAGPCAAVPVRRRRVWPFWVLGAYLLIGILLGFAMAYVIPAMNLWGVIYYALTWPMWPLQHALHQHWMPIFDWMFTFR